MDDSFIHSLVSDGGPQFKASWARFMFNLDLALKVKTSGLENAMAVLAAGLRYAGQGWTTAKASKVLYELTGVPVVRAQLTVYRDIWLLAMSMICEVEFPAVEMTNEQSEAAFGLVACAEGRTQPDQHRTENTQDEDEEELTFPWEETEAELPREIQVLWSKAETYEKPIDVRKLL